MADFKSRRQCGSNAMWRTCLSTRTHASDTATNSCNSFALNNTPDRNFIFTLQCSNAFRGRYTPNHRVHKPQQTSHPRYHSYYGPLIMPPIADRKQCRQFIRLQNFPLGHVTYMYGCISDTRKGCRNLLLCITYVMHTVYQLSLSFLDLIE